MLPLSWTLPSPPPCLPAGPLRLGGPAAPLLPLSLPPSLPPVFRAVETRITQEALRRHVLRVLRTWRERYVFSDDYLNGLQVRIGALFFWIPSTGTFTDGVSTIQA